MFEERQISQTFYRINKLLVENYGIYCIIISDILKVKDVGEEAWRI